MDWFRMVREVFAMEDTRRYVKGEIWRLFFQSQPTSTTDLSK